MRRFLILPAILLFIVVACRQETAETTVPPQPGSAAQPDAYQVELVKWQAGRQDRLRKEDSWFTVVGLWWLNPGENAFGSDPSVPVKLPQGKAPAIAGSFRLADGKVTLKANAGSGVTSAGKPVTEMAMVPDVEGEPTQLAIGNVSFYVIKRGDRFAIRVKDPDSEARREFKGLEYFPSNPSMRFEAKFIPYDPPRQIPIANIVGQVDDQPSPGALLFEYGGTTYRLDPILEEGSDELFVIFADATSGRETYGAGRYLYTKPAKDGKVVLDFNRAYNPPCAFTPFATCPLPPRQNRLPIRIEAGEKAYHASS